jgi:hypothetical protein
MSNHETNHNDETFQSWLERFDRIVAGNLGFGYADLPDVSTFDAWSDGIEPTDFFSDCCDDAWSDMF